MEVPSPAEQALGIPDPDETFYLRNDYVYDVIWNRYFQLLIDFDLTSGLSEKLL